MHDVDANGTGLSKRKSRGSDVIRKSYAEPESSEEDKPLVRHDFFQYTTVPPSPLTASEIICLIGNPTADSPLEQAPSRFSAAQSR